MSHEEIEYPDELKLTAWVITAKHLSHGEKDVAKIVADAIWQERQKWVQVVMPAIEGKAAGSDCFRDVFDLVSQ